MLGDGDGDGDDDVISYHIYTNRETHLFHLLGGKA